MLKNLVSTYALGKINELFAKYEKEEDGSYKMDIFDYAEFLDYSKKLTEEHKRIVVDTYGIGYVD